MKPIYETPLPEGWCEKALKEVTIRRRGYSWDKDQETGVPENGSTPVIRIPNVQDELNLTDLLHLRNVPPEAFETSGVTKNWILYVGSNGNPDRIGDSVLISEDRPMVFASFLQGISTKDPEEVLPEFLAQWMRLHNVHQTFSKTSQQTTGLANFSWSAVKKLPLRFPVDIEEQRMIVTALSSVQDAITVALRHISAAQRMKTALMQQLFTKGLPGRHHRLKTVQISRHSYSIPWEWEVSRIKDVLSSPPFNGVSPQSRPDPPGTPILNVSCISDGKCDPKKATYVDVNEEIIEACRAHRGDFYVLRGNGNREYVATGGWLRDEVPDGYIFSDKLIRLRFDSSKVVDGFMQRMWQSHVFLRRLQSKAESGSGLWMMSKRDIRRETFFLPKPEEQEEIVFALDRCEDAIDSISMKQLALGRLKRSLLQNLLTGKIRRDIKAKA